MNKNEISKWQKIISKKLKDAGIVITAEEEMNIEIVDFGLNNFEKFGLSILTYINTDRVCAKELVLLPNQTCPEHMHPNKAKKQGKEETFRCRKGFVYLYIPSESNSDKVNTVKPPNGSVFTAYNEIVLKEGQQYTIYPNTLHWFKAGKNGAIVSEFSTTSTDELDVFTDKHIQRI